MEMWLIIWLIKVACILLGIGCLVVGPMAAKKGFRLMRTGNVRQIKGGIQLLACGIVFIPMGLGLFYLMFTF